MDSTEDFVARLFRGGAFLALDRDPVLRSGRVAAHGSTQRASARMVSGSGCSSS
jgi:hypothetical protein